MQSTHRNLTSELALAETVLPYFTSDVFLSVLPFSHIFGASCEIFDGHITLFQHITLRACYAGAENNADWISRYYCFPIHPRSLLWCDRQVSCHQNTRCSPDPP